jgi:hypothetical protein
MGNTTDSYKISVGGINYLSDLRIDGRKKLKLIVEKWFVKLLGEFHRLWQTGAHLEFFLGGGRLTQRIYMIYV